MNTLSYYGYTTSKLNRGKAWSSSILRNTVEKAVLSEFTFSNYIYDRHSNNFLLHKISFPHTRRQEKIPGCLRITKVTYLLL